MKRLFLAAAMALSLAACQTLPSSPAPLADTQIDEQGYKTALMSFEAFLDSVDALKAVGVLVPGTPTATKLADAIDTATAGFKAARQFQQAGNETSYIAAMARVSGAMSQAKAILQGKVQ